MCSRAWNICSRGATLWRLELRDDEDHSIIVHNTTASQRQVRRQGKLHGRQAMVISWKTSHWKKKRMSWTSR